MDKRAEQWGQLYKQPEEYDPPADWLDFVQAEPAGWFKIGEPPLQVLQPRDVGWKEMGDNYFLPERFMALITDPRYPACVMDLVVENRRVEYRRVTFVRMSGGPPIDTQHVRRPLDRFRTEAIEVAGARHQLQPDGSYVLVRLRPGSTDADSFVDAYVERTERRGRGKRLSDEDLQEAASVYREALAARKPPVVAVMRAAGLGRSTAGRWVMEARRRGFLGEAISRRPGELQTEEE